MELARESSEGQALLDLSDRAEHLMANAPVGRLATANAEGAPHAIPICFAVAGDLIYSVIDEKPKRTRRLRRMRNIEETGRATLIIDHYEDDWAQLGWVMLRAAASIVDVGAEHDRAIELLRARYPQYHQMHLDDAPVLRLHVEQTTEWWASPTDG